MKQRKKKTAMFCSAKNDSIPIPNFEISIAILNPIDIFHKWCKLNFGLLQGHAKSLYFTAILLKRQAYEDNIFSFYTYFLE